MKTWHEELDFPSGNPMIDRHFTENALFFDIETTGFSPANTSVYLIGCASRRGNRLIVDQFFAERPSEESRVITAFLTLSESFDTIITFNGLGFDIPYLKAKCKSLHISEHFSDFEYLDLYKVVSKLKFLLRLPNFKQKSVETFLGLTREDRFNGGELIDIYKMYCESNASHHTQNYHENATGSPEELLHLLKQHNYEDVLGMPQLLSVLAYRDFLELPCRVTALEANEYSSFEDGTPRKEVIFSLKTDTILPKRISCGFDEFYLIAEGSSAKLRVRLYEGELKFFYDNPKDYYYLPEEDTAIHKSVASYVDKAHRKQATISTCYTWKNALFLPQYTELFSPAFKKDGPRDKKSYFELTTVFAESANLQEQYIRHIFSILAQKKR